MRVAEGISSETIDPSSAVDHCMDIVAMATNALHQIDQVRRDLYKPVLPSSLKDLISCSLGDNSELFGDNLKERQKEILVSNELAQSLENILLVPLWWLLHPTAIDLQKRLQLPEKKTCRGRNKRQGRN